MMGSEAGLVAELGLVAALLLIPVVLTLVLLAAYRDSELVPQPRWLRICLAVLFVVFGAGVLARVLQILQA